MGGGSMPGMSDAEKEYYAAQTELLRGGTKEFEMLKPELLEMLGYRTKTEENPEWTAWNTSITEGQARALDIGRTKYLQDLEYKIATMDPGSAEYASAMANYGYYTNHPEEIPVTVSATDRGQEPERYLATYEKIPYAERPKTAADLLETKQMLGQGIYIDPTTGEARTATEEERLGGMTELERAQYQNALSNAERTRLAMEGKLPIPEAITNRINEQNRVQEEQLARQLGPSWAMSTPGQNLRNQQNLQTNAMLSQVSQGQLDAASALDQINSNILSTNAANTGTSLSQLTGLTQQDYANMMGFPNRSAGLINAYGTAANPWATERANQYTASAQSAANTNAMIGTGISAVATIAAAL